MDLMTSIWLLILSLMLGAILIWGLRGIRAALEALHEEINSKMDLLLQITRDSSYAMGKEDQRLRDGKQEESEHP